MKYMNKILMKLVAFVTVVSLLAVPIFPSTALAQATKPCDGGSNQLTLLPAWYKGLTCNDHGTPQIGTGENGLRDFIFKIILNLIEAMLYIVGYIALGMIIWGGFKYMLFGDNSGGVEGAKKTIQNAVIGLVISIFSITIVNFIGGAF